MGFSKRLIDGSDDPEKNVAPRGVIFAPRYFFWYGLSKTAALNAAHAT